MLFLLELRTLPNELVMTNPNINVIHDPTLYKNV